VTCVRLISQKQVSIGRVAADREASADYAGHSKGCGRSNELVIIRPEAVGGHLEEVG
jgi:hypothetical protein